MSGRQLLDLHGRIDAIQRACCEIEDVLLYYEEGPPDADPVAPARIAHCLEPHVDTQDPEELTKAFFNLDGFNAALETMLQPPPEAPLVITGQGDYERKYYPKDL